MENGVRQTAQEKTEQMQEKWGNNAIDIVGKQQV
jgi:hypothetical protein